MGVWAPFGDCAARADLPEGVDARAVLAALRALPFARDAVVTERHACVYFAEGGFDATLAERALHEALAASSGAAPCSVREFTVRTRYNGPDLAAVAKWAGIGVDEVVARHAGRWYTVRVVGFLPGFAYLGEVDPRIAAPRLPTPRPRVPAGSVGIAGGRTGIYPLGCPGGWNLVGTAMDFHAFDPARGAALSLGDRVRFEPA